MVMGMNEHEGDPPDQTSTFTPELYLGVTLLRRAGALRLADTFAGQGAVDGVPVLLRLLEVTPAPVVGLDDEGVGFATPSVRSSRSSRSRGSSSDSDL